ncbi:GntR family transcriptional regulator [Streptomyces sp. OUCMDZ-4982]|uniref:GntR family transcriptional regulator n=1 Tax=Streptomyces TaxID=1883 RepID=UPI00215BE96A|nr:GntR family transcriptional regulator [Streptomyces sp. OUCMDZ-4982]MCR8947175.1 GntR family transcriptional regulator [Streptomyces sp. OUCMDZ-4982]
MPQQPSPRGTFLHIAEAVKAQIAADPAMTELPTLAELMARHKVSRGVAIRAVKVLKEEGLAEPVRGSRWRVVREGEHCDRRPLATRIADVFQTDELQVGDEFPSTSALADRFQVSRPTVAKALTMLEADGLLSESRQGKRRTVLALPGREERS